MYVPLWCFAILAVSALAWVGVLSIVLAMSYVDRKLEDEK
jgi:quinol-cytochrome oxidoreductase complex cytochrome b subunit